MFDWKKFFNIRIDSAPADELRDRIESDSTVTGANLVILIAAILIACVGLNMDSTAVIIGAMLISPLMGGLVAVSYGMATYNLHFLKRSMVKLFFQIVFSLLTAAIYFALTPITIPTAEMAARTSPTIWDVLIALCGGIAGAVGNTRTVKTNVIPGVAIATALMPPLCTAGYGIAMRSVPYFTGALYLFFINAFFITLSGYFIFKLLDVPMSETISPAHFRFQRHILLLLGIVITIPSIYMAGTTVRESIRTSQIESFINQDMDLHAANVIFYQLKDGTLFVDVLGARLDEETMENLQKKLNDYGSLSKVRLEVVQSPASSLNKEQVQDLISSRLKQATTQTGGKSYKELAEEYYGSYNRETSTISLLKSLNKEAPALFPAIKEIKGGTVYGKDKDDTWAPAAFEVTVTVTSQLSPSDAEKLKNWIASQTELPVSLTIQMETSPSSYFGNGINWNGN